MNITMKINNKCLVITRSPLVGLIEVLCYQCNRVYFQFWQSCIYVEYCSIYWESFGSGIVFFNWVNFLAMGVHTIV